VSSSPSHMRSIFAGHSIVFLHSKRAITFASSRPLGSLLMLGTGGYGKDCPFFLRRRTSFQAVSSMAVSSARRLLDTTQCGCCPPKDRDNAKHYNLGPKANIGWVLARQTSHLAARDQVEGPAARGRDYSRRYPTLLLFWPKRLCSIDKRE
jgi:hypothetical protein